MLDPAGRTEGQVQERGIEHFKVQIFIVADVMPQIKVHVADPVLPTSLI